MLQIRSNDRNGANRHAPIEQRGEGKVSAVANLNARGCDRFIDIGTSGEHLKFGFQPTLFQKPRLVHDDINGVLTGEWSLPTEPERPPAFLFEPRNRFVRDFLIRLWPAPIREA